MVCQKYPLRNITQQNSWVPHHVKSNYIKNSHKTVLDKCSDQIKTKESMVILNKRFKLNGFTNQDTSVNTKTKINNYINKNYMPFKINYISDVCNRKLNKLIKQCDLPIKLVSNPGKNLVNILTNKNRNSKKHNDCELCTRLPNNIYCNDRFLVYKFSCNLCKEIYIGQTNRPFVKRFNEHRRDLINKNIKNALYEHVIKTHNLEDITIALFKIDILEINKNAIDCRLAEARLIKALKPTINRKNELPDF